MKKVLLVGESWEVFSIHLKGFDAFFTTKYDEGAKWLIEA
ncbi:MAG TPA: glutamine amidotransferase, partial [Limnochordia bacterium]|nr:glutamine amidotransferase [Limnochordia bacterium]